MISGGRNRTSALALTLIMVISVIVIAASQPAASQDPDCDQTVHNLYTNSMDTDIVEFPDGGGPNTSLKMLLPIGADVISTQAHLEGFPKNFSADVTLDVALVNDVSNSMDENCPGGDADPGETPCKLNDMKNASKIFANDVLAFPDNRLGLVSYSNNVKSSIPLTDNITAMVQN